MSSVAWSAEETPYPSAGQPGWAPQPPSTVKVDKARYKDKTVVLAACLSKPLVCDTLAECNVSAVVTQDASTTALSLKSVHQCR